MEDISEYQKLYAIESAEHLQKMNDALLCLEKDSHDSETINVMFRAAHTLKGMSATMGYTNIAELTHMMENLMDRVRKNEMNLDPESIDVLFQCLDTLEGMAESPENSSRCDISVLIRKIQSITNKEEPAEQSQKKPPEPQKQKAEMDKAPETSGTGDKVFTVVITLDKSCNLKAARSAVIMRNLYELGEVIETTPTASDIVNGKFGSEIRVKILTKENAGKIEEAVKNITEVSSVEVIPEGATPAKIPETAVQENVPADTGTGCKVYNVAITLDKTCSLKLARSSVILRNLKELGNIVESSPPIGEIEKGKFGSEIRIKVSTKEDAGKIESDIKKINEILNVRVTPETGQPVQAAESRREVELKRAPEAAGAAANLFDVVIAIDKSCKLKGARSAVIIRNLSELGNIVETTPAIGDIESGKFGSEIRIKISTKEDAGKIENAVNDVNEVSGVEVSPVAVQPPAQPEAQPAIQPEAKPAQTQPEAQPAAAEGTQAAASKERIIEKERAAVKNVQSVRVSVERLDSLMNLVGELVINKIRLMQLASDYRIDAMDEALSSLDRLTGELQEEVMASRMVPLEQIFNRFPRMIRDLAKIEGKEIELVVTGSDIELDRTILDEIGDPLVHILRNCVDHGIEMPDVRTQRGKKRRGTIELTARREKNYVSIEVEDDGKGMDPEKFRETAVKRGIVTKEEASKLSNTEVLNLSYLPGFTTADKVTEISGRGVGLDVVKTKIEGMGGSVRLESSVGAGTKISLKLPLTVAIINSQMVKVGKNVYAIPVASVVRDISIRREQIKTIQSEEVVMIRNEVLPLVWLHKLFGVNSAVSEDLIVVVVERIGGNVGLVVDQLIGQQEVIIKNIDNRFLKGMKGFAGATILGDGNVALILDVGTLI